MPRPYLPRLLPKVRVVQSFQLDEPANRSIARTINLKKLPPCRVKSVNWAVNCYRATQSGSASTTLANTLLALQQLEKHGPARQEALELLAHDRAAVDYTTHDLLQSLAKDVHNERSAANEALVCAAQERAFALASHPRVFTSAEPLRFFCGRLRQIFNDCTPHLRGRITEEEAWYRCRQFALAVFSVAGIPHADFGIHPERLTEYLGTDVSID
jgi:hypothetical protein